MQRRILALAAAIHACFAAAQGPTKQIKRLHLLYRYDKKVVAKLPFQAHWIVTKMSHRGLQEPALNDCAMVRHHCMQCA